MSPTQPAVYWPRTTLARTRASVQRVSMARSTRTFSSRSASASNAIGGSIATRVSSCSRWFWRMSRLRAGLLVERAAALDAEVLGHRDLDVVDVAPVPERLEDAVAEAEDEQVADRLLAQVVVDAVDLRLVEDADQGVVEVARRVEVVAERLLDDDPRPALAVALLVEPDLAQVARRSPRTPTGGVAR